MLWLCITRSVGYGWWSLLPPSPSAKQANLYISRIGVYCSDDECVLHPCWVEFSIINLLPGGDLYSWKWCLNWGSLLISAMDRLVTLSLVISRESPCWAHAQLPESLYSWAPWESTGWLRKGNDWHYFAIWLWRVSSAVDKYGDLWNTNIFLSHWS